MNSGISSRFRGSFAVLSLVFLLGPSLATPAAADGLQLADELAGWDCARPNTLASSADGADFYVGGSGPNFNPSCLGFAWFRRDPFSGRLQLRQSWGQKELGRGRVGGPALSPDGRHLYVGAGDSVQIFERGLGGELQKIGEVPSSSTDLMAVSPDGSEVWALGFGAEIFDRGANGLLTFKQRLGALYDHQKPPYAFIDANFAYVGNLFVRRGPNGFWSQGGGIVREDRPTAAVLDASGYFLYISGTFSGEPHIATYDVSTGTATPVARVRIGGQDDFTAGLELDPRTGDIYAISSRGTFFEGYFTEILRFTARLGGWPLTPAGSWVESAGYSNSQLLEFAPDGRHLYTSFEGEPLALFRMPSSGPVYVPGGADPASRYRLPGRGVPAANGDLYLPVAGAILQARKTSSGIDVLASYSFANWPGLGSESFFDLDLSADGRRAAIVSTSSADNQIRMALADRDPATGELRLLPQSSMLVGGFARPGLELSPDGKFLYLSRETRVDIFALASGPPYFVPVETPGLRGRVAIAPSGRDAFVGTRFHLRDPITGLLTPAADPAADWDQVTRVAYGRGGHLLVALAGDSAPRLLTLERSGAGWRLLGEQALPGSRSYNDLFLDPHGRRLFLDGTSQIEPYDKLLQLWDWDSGNTPFRFAAEVDAALLHDRGLFWPAYALSLDGNDLYVFSTNNSLLRVFRAQCEPGAAYSACLGDSRYRVEIDWRDAAGAPNPALPTRIGSDDSRLFTFFDADNWEVLIKVLDGCGLNQRAWVFSAATTDVGHELRVTDTWSSTTKAYGNPAGTPAAAITDTGALEVCAVPSPGWFPTPDDLPPVLPAGELLAVQNGRFEVSATWLTAAGQRGNARSLSAQTDAAGLFYFFSPENWEIQAKVLDGCAINGRYWFFAAATTDVGYTLSVRDRQTGQLRTYTNPVGRAAPAITDIDAFACQ